MEDTDTMQIFELAIYVPLLSMAGIFAFFLFVCYLILVGVNFSVHFYTVKRLIWSENDNNEAYQSIIV